MSEPTFTPATSEFPEHAGAASPRQLWHDAVGRVFKLVAKSYGERTVTYTHVKAVRESPLSDDFEIDVCCVEITARVLDSKRAHSSMCKEGTINQDRDSIITPRNFGDECPPEEYERVAESVLTHVTATLDSVTQSPDDGSAGIDIPLDLPHLKLTDMEVSLLRKSPFLVGNVYLLSVNSRKAALESINQELLRAARSSRLTDACDPVYVAAKSEAVTSLRNKLSGATIEKNGHRTATPLAASVASAPPAPMEPPVARHPAAREPEAVESKPAPVAGRRLGFTPIEKKSQIALALRGKPSAANLAWERQNPSTEGAVYRIGRECGLLEFIRWTHVSGRAVSDEEVSGKTPRAFFNGPDTSYTGPDKAGIYPLFKF